MIPIIPQMDIAGQAFLKQALGQVNLENEREWRDRLG